jgi:hypothetical protein
LINHCPYEKTTFLYISRTDKVTPTLVRVISSSSAMTLRVREGHENGIE